MHPRPSQRASHEANEYKQGGGSNSTAARRHAAAALLDGKAARLAACRRLPRGAEQLAADVLRKAGVDGVLRSVVRVCMCSAVRRAR